MFGNKQNSFFLKRLSNNFTKTNSENVVAIIAVRLDLLWSVEKKETQTLKASMHKRHKQFSSYGTVLKNAIEQNELQKHLLFKVFYHCGGV